jgi:hypothetical protein
LSHFLTKRQLETGRASYTTRPYAFVKVEVVKMKGALTLVVMPEDIGLLRTGSQLFPLPKEVRVLAPDHKPLEASQHFYVSLDTFDPFHGLIDAEDVP